MREKKYIDRLYQEKFRDFEATPREAVWKSISSKLQEKEEKRPLVAPLWSRLGGIAAVLSLILLIGEWFLPGENNRIANEQVRDVLKTSGPSEENAIVAEEIKEESDSGKITQIAERLFSITQPDKKEKITQSSSLKASGAVKLNIPVESEKVASENNPEKAQEKKKPSLFDAIALEEKGEIAITPSKSRIEISTHAAPIYYGNFGKGNFIDSQFNDNNSQGEITYSYGVNISYALSDKVKIRSGVNKVSMSYNTSGIAYQAVVNPKAISSINYRNNGSNMQTGTKNDPVASTTRANIGSIYPGMLNQKMGFIEVPVEVEYNLIDNKFELNVIGGASTLFLDENIITANSGVSTTNLGGANNINNVSFSTNIGLGLDYNLSEKFKLNFEPIIKYQINTFNSSSSDTQPYYLGIYSGFSYKF